MNPGSKRGIVKSPIYVPGSTPVIDEADLSDEAPRIKNRKLRVRRESGADLMDSVVSTRGGNK
jgi:hypothetical protein